MLADAIGDGIDRAIEIQQSAVGNYVARIRHRHFGATPAEIVAALEDRYLATVTRTGAAVGAVAAVPGVGSVAALGLTIAETAAFFEATALFALSVAEVHGTPVRDVERRRMLLLAVVFGGGGPGFTHKGLARSGQRVSRWLVTRYLTKRWIRAIGKVLPFGIGAAIGAASNRAAGRMVIAATRRVFASPAAAPVIPDRPPLTLVEHRPATPAPATLPNGQAPAASAVAATAAVQDTAEVHPPVGVAATAAASVTGKYRSLFDYLAACDSDHVEISFAEINRMVPGGLPKSASTQRSWWGNSPGRAQAKAWLTAGFEVTDVDFTARTVHFDRRDSPE